jgi:hypothetical protein
VLPFPAELAGLVGASLGEPWGQSFTSDLPFLDPGTGRRPLPEHRIIRSEPAPGSPQGTPVAQLAGYGIPFTFDPRPTELVEGVRLSYREGNELVRRDQCGGGTVELVWRGRAQGVAAGGETVAVQGRFDQAGAGKVRVRGVTCQGVSAWAELEVRVR